MPRKVKNDTANVACILTDYKSYAPTGSEKAALVSLGSIVSGSNAINHLRTAWELSFDEATVKMETSGKQYFLTSRENIPQAVLLVYPAGRPCPCMFTQRRECWPADVCSVFCYNNTLITTSNVKPAIIITKIVPTLNNTFEA